MYGIDLRFIIIEIRLDYQEKKQKQRKMRTTAKSKSTSTRPPSRRSFVSALLKFGVFFALGAKTEEASILTGAVLADTADYASQSDGQDALFDGNFQTKIIFNMGSADNPGNHNKIGIQLTQSRKVRTALIVNRESHSSDYDHKMMGRVRMSYGDTLETAYSTNGPWAITSAYDSGFQVLEEGVQGSIYMISRINPTTHAVASEPNKNP